MTVLIDPFSMSFNVHRIHQSICINQLFVIGMTTGAHERAHRVGANTFDE